MMGEGAIAFELQVRGKERECTDMTEFNHVSALELALLSNNQEKR